MINLSFLKNYFASQTPLQKPSAKSDGFTLTELLVTIIIGGIIVSSVTGLLVDIVRTNQQEKVRSATQQDMQRALDYIENDLKNATYVYTGDEIRNARVDGIGSVASNLNVNSNYEIVLAFWKPEQIPYTKSGPKVPNTCDSDDQACQDLQIERRTYTLVLYLQEDDPATTWAGKSVIRRYELRKYENTGGTFLSLDVNAGYVDPIKEANGFAQWPYDENQTDLQSSNPAVNGTKSPVLVDFVDDPNNSNLSNLPTCLDESGGSDTNGNGVIDVYSRTPATSNSFFACVRESNIDGDFTQGNQDVILYLRGNPDGRSGYENDPNSYTPLPTLQSQVLLRGVVDKFFDN